MASCWPDPHLQLAPKAGKLAAAYLRALSDRRVTLDDRADLDAVAV